MASPGFKLKIRPLEIISEDEIENIHIATMNVLKETGVKVDSSWALGLLKENDCIVDYDNMTAKFPEELIEKCIETTPKIFKFKAREEKNDVLMGGDTVYFHSAPGMNTIDLDTFEPRQPTKEEHINYIKVLDYLPHLHKLSAYPYWGFEGVSPVMAIPESCAIKIIYSSKTQEVAYNLDSEIFTLRMAQAAGIEYMSGLHMTSPLGVDKASIINTRRTIEAGFPVYIANGCTCGGTSPITTAGSLAVSNAELLSMIVLIQLIKCGTRILAWDIVWPMNMKTGAPFFGQIQDYLENAMFNQIWRKKYKIPISNGTTGYGSAKNIGFQSGYEKGIALLVSALSGANNIQFHGHVFGELSAHPIQAVLDDDIAGMVGKFIEGETVNEETIALDLIKKVGTTPGCYLDTEHTRKFWKNEQFTGKAADYTSTYSEWTKKGKKNAFDLAKERVEDIIASHEPLPLPGEKVEEIEKILEEAKKYYKEKGML
jgi:trimethylamine---corrinoid protein Co-methyltransferase